MNLTCRHVNEKLRLDCVFGNGGLKERTLPLVEKMEDMTGNGFEVSLCLIEFVPKMKCLCNIVKPLTTMFTLTTLIFKNLGALCKVD